MYYNAIFELIFSFGIKYWILGAPLFVVRQKGSYINRKKAVSTW